MVNRQLDQDIAFSSLIVEHQNIIINHPRLLLHIPILSQTARSCRSQLLTGGHIWDIWQNLSTIVIIQSKYFHTQMINAVSDRIRNIIKAQQHTPIHCLSRSRDNSIQSGRSPPAIPHLPPRSPHKTSRQQLVKSVQFSRENATNSNQNDELIDKVKQRVLQVLYPILSEMSKKIQAIAQSQNIINAISKQMQQTHNYSHNMHAVCSNQIKLVTDRLQKLQYQNQQTFDIQALVLGLKQQQLVLSQKINKLNSPTHQANNRSANDTFYNGIRQAGSYSLSKNPSSTLTTLAGSNKCKCEKLVEEILKSQNHLMNQLKYIKHFQNSSIAKPKKQR